MKLSEFYKNKKVLITGHTGFKGTWLSVVLNELGADVIGYALEPPTKPSMFDQVGADKIVKSYIGDIRDYDKLFHVFESEKPEIVFHMAAQPIVRESYNNPVYTYEVNVIGTVNVLECIRKTDSVISFLNVTTDKVYLNEDLSTPFVENDKLCGFDPYSNSKSCSELVTYSYKNSFFGGDLGVTDSGRSIRVSTCRAGNVIGGGDYAKDRIIPDCYRAIVEKRDVLLRNPKSIRPYQHVLEALFAYISLAALQYDDSSFSGCYNIGPLDTDCVTTEEMVIKFCKKWNALLYTNPLNWKLHSDNGPHEASFLKLDSTKIRNQLLWNPKWSINEAIGRTVDWYYESLNGNSYLITLNQVHEYLSI